MTHQRQLPSARLVSNIATRKALMTTTIDMYKYNMAGCSLVPQRRVEHAEVPRRGEGGFCTHIDEGECDN